MFRHHSFDRDLMNGRRVLDIGCGRAKVAGSVGMDHAAYPGVDIVTDLNAALPVDDESFDVVHANQVLEHIVNLNGLVFEIIRVLRPGGMLIAHTPYFRSAWAHIDPTHVRSFTISTLDYFVRGTYCHEHFRFGEAAFSAKQVHLDIDYRSGPLRASFVKLALHNPFKFENSLLSFLYPFEQITYVLTK